MVKKINIGQSAAKGLEKDQGSETKQGIFDKFNSNVMLLSSYYPYICKNIGMKLNRKDHNKKSGIYAIRNKVDNKLYIGRANNIYRRIRQHINNLNKKGKDENVHLINAWHKYGRLQFEYFVIEYIPVEQLKERELFWQTHFKCTDKLFGYNLRLDSETDYIISDETRLKLSIAQKKRFSDPKERLKSSHTYWKDNPEATKEMGKQVSISKLKYSIHQYTKNEEFVKTWNSVKEILEQNPSYKWHQIYSVCSKYKPSAYGFIWRKELKSNNDIVQL